MSDSVSDRVSGGVKASAARRGGVVTVAATAWAVALVCVYAPDAAGALCAGGVIVTAVMMVVLWAAGGRAGVSRRASAYGRECASGRRAGTPGSLWALAAVCATAGAAVAATVALSHPTRQDAGSFAAGRAVEVHGVVTTKVEPVTDADQVRFEVESQLLVRGDDRRTVRVPIAVRAAPDADEAALLDMGSVVVLTGMARAGEAGDRAVLRLTAHDVEVRHPPPGVLSVGADLRDGFTALAGSLPGPGANLLPGLAVGDTSAVGAELDQAMKDTSLAHLTAVSGANCAIVVGIAFAGAGMLRAPRWLRVTAAGTTLAAFVVLVTPEPSVLRASAMAAIALIAIAIDRRAAGLAVLGLAVTALLIMDPWLATSLGFALSAAATASLLVVARPLATGMSRWMPHGLALVLAVPLAAQLACGPLLVLIDPHVPTYGVVANLVAAPAAPVATVAGLVACLFAGVPGVGWAVAWVAWVPATWVAATAQAFTQLPGAKLPWLEGWLGTAALLGVGVAVLVVLMIPSQRRSARRLRDAAAAVLALLAGAGGGAVLVGTVLGPVAVPGTWAIAQCDVGQGDAVLVRSATAVMLIDTGPDPPALAACLTRLGVESIDLLVLTHFDLDHVGGLAAVQGRVIHVLHGPAEGPGDEAVLRVLRDDGAQVSAATAGMTGTLGQSRWRVLWPRPRAVVRGNDASVVLEVRPGAVDDAMPSGLYLGDLSEATQQALLAAGGLRAPYDVVKVSHHGSADQSAALYADAGGRVALIGVGADNTFGHPRDEALAMLGEAAVVRTDRHGLALVGRDGSGTWLWRERSGVSDRG